MTVRGYAPFMEFPDRAGVMILGGACLFPQALLPLFIFEPRYRRLLAASLEGHRMFIIAMARPGVSRESPLPLAGLGLVRASVENEDGTSNLVLQGLTRVRLGKVTRYKPYREMKFEPLPDHPASSLLVDALHSRVMDLVETRLRQGATMSLALLSQVAGGITDPLTGSDVTVSDCMSALRRVEEPGFLADLVALMLLPNPLARQVILQTVDVTDRLKHLVRFLVAEISRKRKEDAE